MEKGSDPFSHRPTGPTQPQKATVKPSSNATHRPTDGLERPMMIKNKTPFARRLARLGLTTVAAARICGVPTATAENWRQGRTRTPRPVMRLLALWGRLTLTRRVDERIARRCTWPPMPTSLPPSDTPAPSPQSS